jgi:hypothetical protein
MDVYLLLIILVFAILVATLRLRQDRPYISYLPVVLGTVFVLYSFFALPWISFTPLSYFTEGVLGEVGQEIAPDVLEHLFRWANWEDASRVLKFVMSVGYIPGWALVFAIPSTAILVRATIVVVGLVGFLTVLWLPISFAVRNPSITRSLAFGQSLIAVMSALLLLSQMPTIDAWGTTGSFALGLVALTVGAQMGYGVWVAWFGLILVAAGALLSIVPVSGATQYADPMDGYI